jgi:hypothetical protein
VAVTGVAAPGNPAGLVIDAAENLYVLDGTAGTITVVPPSGASHLLAFNNSSLSAPSALALSAGGQSFVVANLGGGSSNALVFLNGNSSTLAFGNENVNSTSAAQTATVENIGNLPLVLNSNDYSPRTMPGLVLTGSNACAGNDSLAISASCPFSVEFAPKTPGEVSQAVKINSNAYNSGNPLIHLSGTGMKVPKLK